MNCFLFIRCRYLGLTLALLFFMPALTYATVPITVTITKVKAYVTEPDEGLESLGEDTADLYAKVFINGEERNSFDIHQDDNPDITPFWKFTVDVPDAMVNVPITIQIWDHDSTSPDDQADADPGGDDDINLTFHRFGPGFVTFGTWDGDTTTGCIGGNPGASDGVFVCFDIGASATGDADGDGLLDGWESVGLDVDGGGIDVDLPAMGAHPLKKDIFVEVDCLVAGNHSHCPQQNALTDVVQAFANAPVANPDGSTGVQLHLDVGSLYGAGVVTTIQRTGGGDVKGNVGDFGGGGNQIPEAGNTIIDYDGATGNPGTSFYTLKSSPGNFFNANRALAFRYAIFGHQTNSRAATNDCTSGQAEGIPGNDFYVTLGGTNGASPPAPCWTPDANGFSVGSRAEQAGTFMHELGHTLGLPHGGSDGVNNKPNYLSVMNYNWQPCTVPPSVPGGLPGNCDYSRIVLPALNETSLDECVGIGGGLGFGAVNWDGDGQLEGVTNCQPPNNSNSQADINNDGVCIQAGPDGVLNTAASGDDIVSGGQILDGPNFTCNSTAVGDDVQNRAVNATQANPLTSFDDWSNVQYGFRTLANFANGIASPVEDEPDPETLFRAREHLSTVAAPVVQVKKTGPSTILPGQKITWTIEVKNIGRGPALETSLKDTLPNGSQVSFLLDTVTVGAVVTKTAEYQVPANACPMDLVNTARADYLDLAANGFSANGTATTRVLDIVPPELTVTVSPTNLWPPDHKLVDINATIVVTDNCDPNPVVRLVSIVSNEPDNGLGDGDTANDIQGAALGTDDRAFQVRSERAGVGSGRIYTITYEAEDASGNKTTKQAVVMIPHSL